MANYPFLPADNTATVIHAIAQHSWPLQRGDLPALFEHAALDLALNLSEPWDNTFMVNNLTRPCILESSSFGIHRVMLFVSSSLQDMNSDEMMPIAAEYMRELVERLSTVFGAPIEYHDDLTPHSYAWWHLPSGVTIQAHSGALIPSVTLVGPPLPTEPAKSMR